MRYTKPNPGRGRLPHQNPLPKGRRLSGRNLSQGGEAYSGVPSPQPYPLADMAIPCGNLAKARLREKDRACAREGW
jgi:hypothetical protein